MALAKLSESQVVVVGYKRYVPDHNTGARQIPGERLSLST